MLTKVGAHPRLAQVFVSLKDQRLLMAKEWGAPISNTYTAHTHTHTHAHTICAAGGGVAAMLVREM